MAPNPAKRVALRALSLTMTALLLSGAILAPAASALGGLPVDPAGTVDGTIDAVNAARREVALATLRTVGDAIDAANDLTGGLPVEPTEGITNWLCHQLVSSELGHLLCDLFI